MKFFKIWFVNTQKKESETVGILREDVYSKLAESIQAIANEQGAVAIESIEDERPLGRLTLSRPKETKRVFANPSTQIGN